MGGKSDDSGSREMINMQKAEAAAARAKEVSRQGRISTGLNAIRAAFEGGPVMGRRNTSYTVGSGAALPSGYSYVGGTGTTPSGGAAPPTVARYRGGRDEYQGQGDPRNQTQTRSYGGPHEGPAPRVAASTGGGPQRVRGPDGKLYNVGDVINTGEEDYDTGLRGKGIGNEFYDKYKGGIVDYYMPQVQEKYKKAGDELTYRLARAGTLRSSMAGTEQADLSKQNQLAEGKVRSDADAAAADLRSRVAAERAKAESQLYATENPEVATNQALASLRNITAEEPDVSPLGDIFSIAAVGGANYLKGRQADALGRQYVPGWKKSSTSVVG